MAPKPILVMNLQARDDEGTLLDAIAFTQVSPISRTIGLQGDTIVVNVPASAWPADGPQDADFEQPIRITFGLMHEMGMGDDQIVVLDGYRLVQAIDSSRGAPQPESSPGGSQAPVAQLVTLTLTTLPGFWRDGRGGILREGVLNKLAADGTVDDAHALYRTNSQLATLAIEAMGFVAGMLPASLDDCAPPGPLDWHNAPAMLELESLLQRIGHRAVFANDGQSVTIVQLLRAEQDIDIPAPYDDLAEPFDLYSAPALRGRRVLVTSGRTRSTVVTSRSLDSGDPEDLKKPLEWVWFDRATQRWLNSTETQATYPGTTDPDDLDAYKAGPGPTSDEKIEYARLFTAVRFAADDIENVQRIANVRTTVNFAGQDIAGQIATIRVRASRVQALGGQLVNEPIDAMDSIIVEGAKVSPQNGVVVLPSSHQYVRMSPDSIGGRSNAVELVNDDLEIFFAHEAATGDYLIDFFVAGFEVVDPEAMDPVVELDAMTLAEAIDDPNTLRLEAKFIQRVLTNADGTDVFTPINDAELTAIAKEIALTHVGAARAKSGVVEIRGLHSITPGDFGGAVSSVDWDIDANRTTIAVNQHEVPGSIIDRLELSARKSFATGLTRHDTAGTAIDALAVRSVEPRQNDGSQHAARGAEDATPPTLASGVLENPILPTGFIFARITGSTLKTTNRWDYDWEQVTLNTDNIYATVAGGMTSATHGIASNPAEAGNTGLGVEGNGVNRNNLPGTFEMQPVPDDHVVTLLGPIDNGEDRIWVMLGGLMNADDGPCPGASS